MSKVRKRFRGTNWCGREGLDLPRPLGNGSTVEDIYNQDVELRADFTSLKGGFRLVGWQLSALTAVILFMGSAIFYFIDKVENHFPAAVVAVLAEKNYLHVPTPPSIETLASTPPPKTGK
ncbi:hypothetical protein HOY82DRAFT_617329 [Tuber indicum]|nr:hypothetical protein HOY82DRAFT_617329 [Tuber indicum]